MNNDLVNKLYEFIKHSEDIKPMIDDVLKNLAKHHRKGKYDATEALKSWMHVTQAGAYAYNNIGKPLYGQRKNTVGQFDKKIRTEVALKLQENFNEELYEMSADMP